MSRRVVVSKSARTLTLFEDGCPPWTVPVVVGRNMADKLREGDLATPEGEFYVCYKNPHSKYHRFIGLSYPNTEDAQRGLRDGLISQTEHDAICAAMARRECPPWKTALGGELGIHGPSPNVTWTHGCIAMGVAEIQWLYDRLMLGDPVVVKP